MVKLTLIARVRDGLPLAEGLDTDKEHEMYSYKSQAKVCYVNQHNLYITHAHNTILIHADIVQKDCQ